MVTVELPGTLGGVSQSVSLTGHYVDSWGHWEVRVTMGSFRCQRDLVEESG